MAALPRATGLAAASIAGAAALSAGAPRRVYAEEAVGSPLYASPKPTVTLVPVETELQAQVGRVRRHVESATAATRDSLFAWVSRWVDFEHTVERRVKSLVPAQEPVVPGLLYVGVATLAGSIFGRYRSLPIRLLAPPTAFVASLAYFQPGLSHNLVSYYKELEGAHLPASVAQQRTAAEQQWAQARNASEGATQEAASTLTTWWTDALVFVQNSTGLNVAPHAAPAESQHPAVASPGPAPTK